MVLGRQLEARQIEGATRILADQGLNIDSILRLTGRKSIKNPGKHIRACIQFSLRGEPIDRQEMQSKLMKLSQEMEIDFSFQRDDMFRRMRRLICFDMDSTLIQTECIDELAERNGVGAEVRAITESAMRGEIDFKESFTRRPVVIRLPFSLVDSPTSVNTCSVVMASTMCMPTNSKSVRTESSQADMSVRLWMVTVRQNF